MAATLRVILGVDNAAKLTLANGLPESFEDLKDEIQKQFGLDIDFDNEFVNLTMASELNDKATLKVIHLSENSSMAISSPTSRGFDETSSLSSATDTDILSSSESTFSDSSLRSQPWPSKFQIPAFSYNAQIQLDRGNQAFYSRGTFLTVSPKLKSSILDCLASEIIKYKVYPSSG